MRDPKDALVSRYFSHKYSHTLPESGPLRGKILTQRENIIDHGIEINEFVLEISKEYKDGHDFIKMEFMDNGIGISDEKKKIIFEQNNRKYKGSKGMGIGLSLVKKIIDSYSGHIYIENRVQEDYSKGSNFVMLIPKAI